VCESTVKNSYWDRDGVQCNLYDDWVEAAYRAGYQVVWSPLSPKYRKQFDAQKALDFFKTVQGLQYGYHNFLFGWIDTPRDNYPCMPPDYTTCVEWIHLEVLSILLDGHAGLAESMWLEALNKRVGTVGLRTIEVYKAAIDRGINLEMLPTIPERDSWLYNTTRDGSSARGEAMVCSTFVCRMWKAAGLFQEVGNEVNCGEFTPYDVYSLKVFDDDFAFPAECKEADPNNPSGCQIMGKYTLRLNEFNSREISAGMAELCPSLAPRYIRPQGC